MNLTAFSASVSKALADKNHRLILFFCLFVLLLGGLFLVTERAPVIASIDPQIGSPGDELTIVGRHFGRAQSEGRIEIAGTFPTSGAYVFWSDTEIRVRIPETVESGLVRVYTKRGRSNSFLFTDKSQIPLSLEAPGSSSQPYVQQVSPQSVVPGQELAITGSNFGQTRGTGTVYFSWQSADLPDATVPAGTEDNSAGLTLLPVSDLERGYSYWSDREIRVRVPDGASTGTLTVKTDTGTTNSAYVEVKLSGGSKVYRDRKSYAITYRTEVSGVKSQGPNDLYIWIPKPLESSTQRAVKLLSQTVKPDVNDPRGLMVFHLQNMENGQKTVLEQSFLVNVFSVRSSVDPDGIRPIGSLNPKLDDALIAPDGLVPSDSAAIMAASRKVVQTEKNPYRVARLLYDYLLDTVALAPADDRDPVDSFASNSADPYAYAVIYCALLRASRVPAQPVSGYIIDNQQKPHRHYWVEAYFDGFGWFPIDPTLGKGYKIDTFPGRADSREFYFGNLDDQHLAFSRGFIQLKQMNSDGRPIRKLRMYSLQSEFEESSGGLTSYASYWPDMTITGVY